MTMKNLLEKVHNKLILFRHKKKLENELRSQTWEMKAPKNVDVSITNMYLNDAQGSYAAIKTFQIEIKINEH
jgi:hypothetical protein